ncbi:hypothetical protein [Acetobacter sp. DsW_063]|nr:hypothetical protein [Acetobacter sp. DsW_063]
MTRRAFPSFDRRVASYPYRRMVLALKRMIGGAADGTTAPP